MLLFPTDAQVPNMQPWRYRDLLSEQEEQEVWIRQKIDLRDAVECVVVLRGEVIADSWILSQGSSRKCTRGRCPW